MPGRPGCRTLSALGMLLLSYMVVVTSHPDNSVIHKRSYGAGGGNKVATSAGTVRGSPFSTPNGTEVLAQVGGMATLPCNIKKHNTAVVTWIRKRDHHLLTVGGSTYSHDNRFAVGHARHVPAAWPLSVRRVQTQDAGTYECQLSTHPPSSILVLLKVVEAYAEVEGAPDLHVRSGSELRLVCRLHAATETPAYVFWYHGARMINYDTARGVRVTGAGSTAAGVAGSGAGSGAGSSATSSAATGSELSLTGAGPADAGNYSCVPSNARPATITVHVHADAACPPLGQVVKPGQDAGLIVQCPLATKDRQDVNPVTPESSSKAPCLHQKEKIFISLLCSSVLLNILRYN